MRKMDRIGNGYHINSKKPFASISCFKSKTVGQVFEFAYDMTFGRAGEHRDHRSGGSVNRTKGQIFINCFQGKLSELAVYNEFRRHNPAAYSKLSPPDFDVYGLGEWDDSDIKLMGAKISVKSTKSYGNLLLMESSDWDGDGEYLPNKEIGHDGSYDYFILVRIDPDGESRMKASRFLYSNEDIN
jgi:hypothetical protein